MLRTTVALLFSVFVLTNTAQAQLVGCPTGCDTLIYDSDFNVASGNWKNEPLNPLSAGCMANDGDRWEWGTTVNMQNSICGSYTAHPTHPSGQTKFWATELAGCFCNSSSGVDSMYIYTIIDMATVAPPIRIELEHWTDGCGPDHLALYIDNSLIWDESAFAERPATFYSTNIVHPRLTNAAGNRTVLLTMIFFMTSVCNGNGAIIPKLDIRACKASCVTGGPGGGGAVPTTSEWGLIFLALVFINISLVVRRQKRLSHSYEARS